MSTLSSWFTDEMEPYERTCPSFGPFRAYPSLARRVSIGSPGLVAAVNPFRLQLGQNVMDNAGRSSSRYRLLLSIVFIGQLLMVEAEEMQ